MRLAALFSKSSVIHLLASCAVVVIIAGCGTLSSGEAACGVNPPTLEAEPSRAVANGTFNLQGTVFFSDFLCDDGGPAWLPGGSSGLRPDDAIRIEFVQGEKTWALATVGSGDNLAFETIIDVPADAQPGRAVVRATSSTVGTASGMSDPVITSFVVLDANPGAG